MLRRRALLAASALALVGLCLLLCHQVPSPIVRDETAAQSAVVLARKEPAKAAPRRDGRLRLLVFVITSPKASILRSAIRKTWMQLVDTKVADVTVRFVIGAVEDVVVEAALREESRAFGDVHRADCREGYAHISQKVLRSITEIVEAGYQFDYIIKVDDDTWLQLDILAQTLSTRPRTRFYFGNIYTNNPRFKNPQDMWYEPNYFSEYYPSYATGGTGYVLSVDLARWVARNKDDLVVFTGNEDAMVGTWFAAHKNVPPVGDERFIQLYGSDQCIDVPLGVHLGPYPVKWPHATISVAMHTYYSNYKATGGVCSKNRMDDMLMVAIEDTQTQKKWYRLASFASGQCLGMNGREVMWESCSQYDAQQQQQQWELETAATGVIIRPRSDASLCMARDGESPHGTLAMDACGTSSPHASHIWSSVPQSTGKPGQLRHTESGQCVAKYSVESHPAMASCVGAFGLAGA